MCPWIGYGHGGIGYWGGIGGMLMMVLFWGLIIAGGIILFRRLWPNATQQPSPVNSALEILKQRYAKGEITREEFEQMKIDLL